ncbi:N-acetyltransferase [Paenibacillus cisolokensis]|uniref:N-acetyltransferase n=1 Tax=Paenibacillus cisolokensis TaxID=1658519 RepID=A0ABQ4NAZ7_9BACL|nr:GNAT family N-acetyltransferase [Paenibacillus cisolokensis]GIQ65414.1 N-acetyltransferase [Paenibacillus cisolokensis]
MPDMLVKLYALPETETPEQYAARTGITVRRAIGPEKLAVAEWVEKHFSKNWRSECEVAFSRQPVSCLVAVRDGKLLGFACYDATCKGFSVRPVWTKTNGASASASSCFANAAGDAQRRLRIRGDRRGRSGRLLRKTAGAVVIEGSVPGVYAGMIKSS